MLSSFDSFQSPTFSVREYIEDIARIAEVSDKTQSGGQELLPLINIFENALGDAERLYEGVKRRVNELEGSGDEREASRRLERAFQRTFAAFAAVEKQFDQTGSTATRAGQEIDTLHHQRRRAGEAQTLVRTLQEFAGGSPSPRLEAMIFAGAGLADDPRDRDSGAVRARGARILQRLLGVVRMDIPGTAEARRLIEELAERVENSLLADFHAAFDAGDAAKMQSAATVLVAFNGGQSCVQSFVSQHAFFASPVMAEAIVTRHHPNRPVEPLVFGQEEPLEPAVRTLFGQIGETADADWKYLEAVFEQPALVMDLLLQRIFQEPVQVHIEECLRQARSHSIAAYLRTLFACHRATTALVKQLGRSYAKHLKQREAADDRTGQIKGLAAELFSPFVASPGYLDLERRALADLLALATQPLAAFVAARRAARSRGVFSRAGQGAAPPPAADLAAKASLYMFDRGVPLVSPHEGADGIPSLAVVSRCLTVYGEAMVRCHSLLAAPSRAQAMHSLFSTVLDTLVARYLETAADLFLETGEFGSSSRSGFDPAVFAVATAVNNILAALQLFFQNAVVPLAVSVSPECYKDLAREKTAAFSRVVAKINLLLCKQLDGIVDWIYASLLAKQKKTDYRPRPEDGLSMCSQACEATQAFLQTVIRAAAAQLDKQNACRFLTELGVAFHAVFLEHLRKYTISDAGAVLLRSDLKMYSETMQSMGPAWENVRDRYELLAEIGNIFLVRPENLRLLMQEGILGRLDPKLVHPFLAQRADYKSAQVDVLFPEIGPSFSHMFD